MLMYSIKIKISFFLWNLRVAKKALDYQI